jgi:hypothetical protein
LDDLPFHSICEEEAAWVEQSLEEREVFEVVKELNKDMAVGLDGVFMVFFQSCWEVIKEDVMKVFLEFHMCTSSLKI